MGYAAAPRVAFIVYGIQTFFTAIVIIRRRRSNFGYCFELAGEYLRIFPPHFDTDTFSLLKKFEMQKRS